MKKKDNKKPSKRWSDKSGFQYERAVQGVSNEWFTPPELVESLGKFDLDPCAGVRQAWKLADKQYTTKDNGLEKPWAGRVFCNPPYGRGTKYWVQRMIQHHNGILLIFARVETKAFFELWKSADAMLFLAGRISFYHVDGSKSAGKPAASVLVAFDPKGKNINSSALQKCGYIGSLVTSFGVVGERKV